MVLRFLCVWFEGLWFFRVSGVAVYGQRCIDLWFWLLACLLACWLAGWLACLLACLLAWLYNGTKFLRKTEKILGKYTTQEQPPRGQSNHRALKNVYSLQSSTVNRTSTDICRLVCASGRPRLREWDHKQSHGFTKSGLQRANLHSELGYMTRQTTAHERHQKQIYQSRVSHFLDSSQLQAKTFPAYEQQCFFASSSARCHCVRASFSSTKIFPTPSVLADLSKFVD